MLVLFVFMIFFGFFFALLFVFLLLHVFFSYFYDYSPSNIFSSFHNSNSKLVASARSDADRALEDYALAQTDFEQRRDADQVALQRLRDELRDTQTELRVLRDARPAAGENGIAIDVSAQHNGVGGKPAQLLAAQEMLATIRHLRKMLLEP